MPGPYPQEFREDVVAVARSRESGVTLAQIAKDFGISEQSLSNWLKQADVEEGRKPGQTKDEAEPSPVLCRSYAGAISGWDGVVRSA